MSLDVTEFNVAAVVAVGAHSRSGQNNGPMAIWQRQVQTSQVSVTLFCLEKFQDGSFVFLHTCEGSLSMSQILKRGYFEYMTVIK